MEKEGDVDGLKQWAVSQWVLAMKDIIGGTNEYSSFEKPLYKNSDRAVRKGEVGWKTVHHPQGRGECLGLYLRLESTIWSS